MEVTSEVKREDARQRSHTDSIVQSKKKAKEEKKVNDSTLSINPEYPEIVEMAGKMKKNRTDCAPL